MIAHGLRPAFLVLLLLTALAPRGAAAQDARVTLLAKQLDGAKDPRLRVQTVVVLGGTGSPFAAVPLCKVLKDPEVIVRTAAANALGELKAKEAQDCLKAAAGDSDSGVKAAVARALAAGVVVPGSLYVSLEPIVDKVGGLPPDIIQLTDKLMREKLKTLGAGFSPQGEDKKSAMSLVKNRQLKGYALRLQMLPHGAGLKIEMLVMTYPDNNLTGTFNVKAAGAKHETLLKVMVPRIVDDAAAELQWK
jgi:HEAT repeats